MVVKISLNDSNNPPGKRADAEIHFTDGDLAGLKLVGFAVWERRAGGGFPRASIRSTANDEPSCCYVRSRTTRRRTEFGG
jgi:hypothetical protein